MPNNLRECPYCKQKSPRKDWAITVSDVIEKMDKRLVDSSCTEYQLTNVHFRVQYGECPCCHERIEVYRDRFYINDFF